MRRFAMWLVLSVVVGPAFAQQAMPEFLIQSAAGPIDLRYVDFGTKALLEIVASADGRDTLRPQGTLRFLPRGE